MRLDYAIDAYIRDQKSYGRINSVNTERSYRWVLDLHAKDVGNRDPRTIGRDDVKRTLARWTNPNTQAQRRSVLLSFYDWTVEEGIRPHNPARQTRRPKTRKPDTYRMTRAEVVAFLNAAVTTREQRTAFLGVCAGLRRGELVGLQGRHLARPGFIWVSPDIGKGGRERWVPVITDIAALVTDLRRTVAPDHYVLTRETTADPPHNTRRQTDPTRGVSVWTLARTVTTLAERAQITADLTPHSMRHAFGDHIARYAGIQAAQAMLGHASVQTTEIYTGGATLDDLTRAVAGVTFLATPTEPPPTAQQPSARSIMCPTPETADLGAFTDGLFAGLREKVALYAAHFEALHAH